MSDKISVNPENVRGLGDIVSPKLLTDFDTHNVTLTSDTATIDDDTLPVITSSYLAGSKFTSLDFDTVYPSTDTSAVIGFTLVNASGTAISSATVSVYVNGVLRDICTTDSDGEASYTIDLTIITASLYHVKLVYSGDSSISGCFHNFRFWHGDTTSLTLISDANPVVVDGVSHLLATLTGTNLLEEPVGIPGQPVSFYEVYTPLLTVNASPNIITNGVSSTVTAHLQDSEDGNNIPGEPVNIYACHDSFMGFDETATARNLVSSNTNYFNNNNDGTLKCKGALIEDYFENTSTWEMEFDYSYPEGMRYTGLIIVADYDTVTALNSSDILGSWEGGQILGLDGDLPTGASIEDNPKVETWNTLHVKKTDSTTLVLWKNDDTTNSVTYTWSKLADINKISIGGKTNYSSPSQYGSVFLRNWNVKGV